MARFITFVFYFPNNFIQYFGNLWGKKKKKRREARDVSFPYIRSKSPARPVLISPYPSNFIKEAELVSFQLNSHSIDSPMDAQEGTQQSQQLILAHNVFLLKHPDVPDIEKVRLKDEVLNSVKSNGNSPDSTLIFSESIIPIQL